jgi:hypothetical protein
LMRSDEPVAAKVSALLVIRLATQLLFDDACHFNHSVTR